MSHGPITARHIPARHAGDAPAPVVALVHGMADSSNAWQPVLPMLESCDVWLFDMPWSGSGGAGWATRRHAAAWWDLALEMCPVAPDLIVGHSFAATTLVDWARAGTAIDPGLLLLAPVFVADKAILDWDYIDRFARSVPAQLQASLDARMPGRPSSKITAAMAHKLAAGLMPGGMLALFSMLERLSGASKAAIAGRVEVLVGDGDTAMAQAGAQALAQQCGTRVHVIPGCGHGVMVSHPATVATAIKSMLHLKLRNAA